MSTLKVSIQGERAQLSGVLDENSDLSSLGGLSGQVAFDFKEVARVNSCGVREWVNLIQKIQGGAQIKYENCPIVVVKQLNAVPDFQGKAKVASFFAPYFCEACDEEAVKLLDTSHVKGDAAPEMKCDSCGGALNFDAIANQYFSFLKR
jgi:hypothetical protein